MSFLASVVTELRTEPRKWRRAQKRSVANLRGIPFRMPVEVANTRSNGGPREAEALAGRAFEYFYHYSYLAVPLLVLLQGSVSHITLPGLYMDAVNPDYVILRLLHWNPHIYGWILPGTCILDIFPTIIQLYHGAIPYYIGMPVYILFGTGVAAIRIANFVFASLVLLSANMFLRAFGVRPLFVGVILAVLALDPGFLFSFRTQSYITLLPIAFVLLSTSIVENAGAFPSRRACAVAGLLVGLSVYGYFIYLFLVPAAATHLWWNLRINPQRGPQLIYWFAGLALGASPYLIGYTLMFFATGGAKGFERFLTSALENTAPGRSKFSPWQGTQYFMTLVSRTVSFEGQTSVMLNMTFTPYFHHLKRFLLIDTTIIYLVFSLLFVRKLTGIVLIAGLFSGMVCLFAVFRDRLGFHHVAMTLPLLYLALALCIEHIADAASVLGRAKWVLALPFLILGIGNAIDRQQVMLELERTGGVGLASDAIERFAADSLTNPDATFGFFPDWGIFMPFEMVTGGQIPLLTEFSPDAARRKLCEGQDALLAIMNDHGLDRLPPWIGAVDWGTPEMVTYRQRDNVPILTSVRWRSSASVHSACV